jgi:hypothetical protein
MDSIINSSSQQKYSDLLQALIPRLNSFPFAEGGEGRAYFIGDNFVIKQFIRNQTDDIRHFFEKYASEMQHFAKLGYNIPQIYAYKRVTNEVDQIMDMLYDTRNPSPSFTFYILEQRINAPTSLYCGDVALSGGVAKSFCSQAEFNSAIKNPSRNSKLFREIYRAYCNDCLDSAEYILSMSENNLEKFITNTYDMYISAKYSCPDIFYGNVLRQNGNLFLIDNLVELRDGSRAHPQTEYAAQNFIIYKMMELFEDYGNFVHIKNLRNGRELVFSAEFENLRTKGNSLCKEVLLKMVRAINKCLDNPQISNKAKYYAILKSLKYAIDQNDAAEVMQNFDSRNL